MDRPSEENKNVSSLLSFFSNKSAPLDTYLLTHAQNLRSEVDMIKINICSILKLEVNKFAVITPLMIKSCSSLNKSTLAEGLLSLLGLAENVCAVVSGQRCDSEVKSPSYLSAPSSMSVPMGHTTSDDSSLHNSLEAIQTSIKNLHLDLKIAQKDVKIKDDKVQDLKREVSELQKVKIDKIESIKQLQSMLKSQEKEEARAKEIQDQLKKEIKDSNDECTWLKKEIDGVSEILIKRNHEIKELNSKITSLQATE